MPELIENEGEMVVVGPLEDEATEKGEESCGSSAAINDPSEPSVRVVTVRSRLIWVPRPFLFLLSLADIRWPADLRPLYARGPPKMVPAMSQNFVRILARRLLCSLLCNLFETTEDVYTERRKAGRETRWWSEANARPAA